VLKIFKTSIRAQLFLMAAIVAVPAAGIILYSGFAARKEAMAAARVETKILADGIAYQQQSRVASAKQLLSGLAQLPDIRIRDREKVQPILTDILTMNPQYLNIIIVDRRGKMWVSAIPTTFPINVADRQHFINAMATGQFSSGECIISRLLRKPTISFGYPYKNAQGELAGVIVVNFDLGYCDKLLENARLPEGSSFLLTDYKGIILSRGINPSPFVGKPTDPEMLRQMQQGPETDTFISEGFLDGVRRFVTYRKLNLDGEQAPYMYVRAAIPVAAGLSKANMALFLNLGLLSTVLLFGFIAAWLIGKRWILERISALQAASQRLAEGDFRSRVSAVVKGGELGSLGESFDAMAEELQKKRNALEAKALILENMGEGVSECDGNGILVSTNPAFDAMFGYGKGELPGKEMKSLLEDPAGRNGELCARIIQHLQQSPLWCGELHNRKKDGTSFHAYARISKIPGTCRYISVQEDITERMKLERMKDEMISAVSHDMRTPLTAMLGFHEFLLENEVNESTLKDALATMFKETKRLEVLIGNFLDLQRIKARQMGYDFANIEVGGLLQETATLFANASRNHRIMMEALPDLPPVYGDEARLHQVLNNLVSNAIKYSPGRCDIILGAKREEEFVTLWVRDRGIGIPADALHKIFDRFYRIVPQGASHPPGTGLGLALVQEIVKDHGGKVWVESAPGEGSTFYVSLPIVQTGSASGSQAADKTKN
jgi:PAS domain S-box-containing protein